MKYDVPRKSLSQRAHGKQIMQEKNCDNQGGK
jgi:hypothetical protein